MNCDELKIIMCPVGRWSNLTCVFYKCCCLVTNSSLTLCNPTDCSPQDFSVHGISQARILEWVAISSSGGSSWPRNQTHVSCRANPLNCWVEGGSSQWYSPWMARLPTPQPQGRQGSWLQSSRLLTTHLRSPEDVGQKTHAQSHFKKQSSDVHGAEGSVFQHTPPPAPLYSSNQEGAIKDQTYRTYRACCWAHRLFPQHLKDSCLGFRQG